MFKFFRFSTVAIAATIAFQFPPTTALAKEKWVYVGSNSTFRFYVDTNSLKKNGDFVWFWTRATRIELSEPESKIPIYSTHTYSSFDCQSGVIRFRHIRVYDRNQKLLPEFSGDYTGATASADWNHPVTRYVCRR